MLGIAYWGLLRRSIFPNKAHGIPAARHAWQLSDTDGYSKMPQAALLSSQATIQVPMRFFTNFHATLASSHAVLPASVRHRLIAHAPAAVKFLLRPCHAVFAIFCAHRTKPPLVKAIGFSPLCRLFDDALSPLCRFDDAPIVARPASIIKTSA